MQSCLRLWQNEENSPLQKRISAMLRLRCNYLPKDEFYVNFPFVRKSTQKYR